MPDGRLARARASLPADYVYQPPPANSGTINRGTTVFWLDEREGEGLTFDEKVARYQAKQRAEDVSLWGV